MKGGEEGRAERMKAEKGDRADEMREEKHERVETEKVKDGKCKREKDWVEREVKEDVTFVGMVSEPAQSFRPTNAAWRLLQSQRLGLPVPLDSLPERQAKKELGKPIQVNNIVGDGNCLYRALSYEVCGTQDCHEQMRALIVNFMCHNHEAFSAYVGQDLGDYISQNTEHIADAFLGVRCGNLCCRDSAADQHCCVHCLFTYFQKVVAPPSPLFTV